jgi:hypothetical protein
MEEPLSQTPVPVNPLAYQSGNSNATALLRMMAGLGVAVGLARLVEGVMTMHAFGLAPWAWGLSAGAPWWYRSLGAATAVAALILGGMLLTASVALLKGLDWSTSLLQFCETCALVLFALGAVGGAVYTIGASSNSLASSLLYSLGYQASQSVGNLSYPILALAILRWNGHH